MLVDLHRDTLKIEALFRDPSANHADSFAKLIQQFHCLRGREERACDFTVFPENYASFNKKLVETISRYVGKTGFLPTDKKSATHKFRIEKDGEIDEQITVEIVEISSLEMGMSSEDVVDLKALRETDPIAYKKLKRQRIIEEALACDSASKKTHWLFITLRKAVTLSGSKKLLSLAQRVSWLNSTNELKSAFTVHGDQFLVEDWSQVMGELFGKAIDWKPEREIQKLKNAVAELCYLFANVIPFSSESDTIAKCLELAIYQFHGFTSAKPNNSGGYKALSCLTFQEFLKSYDSLTELGPVEGLTSNLLENRGMYRGSQEQYHLFVHSIIRKMTEKVEKKTDFEKLIDWAAGERKKIADVFNSEDKKDFGLPRGKSVPDVVADTPLFTHTQQGRYGHKSATRIYNLLQDFPFVEEDINGKTKKWDYPGINGKKERLSLEFFGKTGLQKLHKDSATFREPFNSNPTMEQMRKLRKQSLDGHKAGRLATMIESFARMRPMLDIEGKEIAHHCRTHYMVFTQRVEIEGKLVPVAMKVMGILHTGEGALPNLKAHLDSLSIAEMDLSHSDGRVDRVIETFSVPVSAIHTDHFQLPALKKEMARLYNAALSWTPDKGIDELKDTVAKLRYLFANARPYFRGSGAIGEWLELSIYRALGFKNARHKQGVNGDYEALSCLYSAQFLERYDDLIELDPRTSPE